MITPEEVAADGAGAPGLNALREQLRAARSSWAQERQGPRPAGAGERPAGAILLAALEAYAAALTARHLVLPRDVHDELRLHRNLQRHLVYPRDRFLPR